MLSVTKLPPLTLYWTAYTVIEGPSFWGSAQVTSSIVVGSRFGSSSVGSAALTVGADGVDGASLVSSVTVIVTAAVALPPFPSITFTSTE